MCGCGVVSHLYDLSEVESMCCFPDVAGCGTEFCVWTRCDDEAFGSTYSYSSSLRLVHDRALHCFARCRWDLDDQ